MSVSSEELERIMNHMNQDHVESLVLYAHAFANRKDVTSAKMIDLSTSTISLELDSGECLSVPLTAPVHSAKEAHTVLVDMHKQAVQKTNQ